MIMYESKMKSEEIDRLFQAILSLQDLDECYRFFDDLCTYAEIQSMTQRLQVAAGGRQTGAVDKGLQLLPGDFPGRGIAAIASVFQYKLPDHSVSPPFSSNSKATCPEGFSLPWQ